MYTTNTMDSLPTHVRQLVFGCLRREYDWERQQVIDELNKRCAVIGDDFEFLELVPSLMMPTECMWRRLQSKYRCYRNKVSVKKCQCGYCRAGLWGIY